MIVNIMKANIRKIMKSNYDSDYMGAGKSRTSKHRYSQIFKVKINRELNRQFNEEISE